MADFEDAEGSALHIDGRIEEFNKVTSGVRGQGWKLGSKEEVKYGWELETSPQEVSVDGVHLALIDIEMTLLRI